MPTHRPGALGDRYALDEVIGRGGMADVYRGTDLVLDRSVAVKLLRDVTASGSDRARFEAEAKTLAQLNHPGLVTILDAGTADDRPYLVMELVDGPSLADLCEDTPLALDRVCTISIQVAEALAYAHRCGVVHRDVKPGNVLVGSDGRVYLTDFGIARLLGDTARLTNTGTTIGSPAYLSPEQVRGVEVTGAADVYSLGLVMVEALTGSRVYQGSPTEAALARLTTPPTVPNSLPGPWRRLLTSMTAMEPSDRPTTAEVAAALRRVSDETGGGSLGDGHTRVLSQPVGTDVADKATHGGTTHVLRVPRRGPRLLGPPSARRLGPILLGLLVLGALAVVLLQGGPDAQGGDLPSDVPPRLEQPLRDLHDAVNGSDR